MPEEKEHVAKFVIHAGPSLTDSDIDPVEIFVDYDVLGALWACDETAWTALLHTVESDIRRDGA